MFTPSGRFQTSTRLCLSISDSHPKSFDPAWQVLTILVALLSFMTSEEETAGSINASESVRKMLAQRSRIWNSTGGGIVVRRPDGTIVPAGTEVSPERLGFGDAGTRFRSEWPEVDVENWKWCDSNKINFKRRGIPVAADTGEQAVARKRADPTVGTLASGRPGLAAARGEEWLRRYPLAVGLMAVVCFMLLAKAIEKGIGSWRWS